MPKDNVQRLKVLFLCTGNSCRRQMAEAWARHLKVDTIEPYSAGIETHGLHPKAVRVMAEVGVDISGQRSTLVDNVMDVDFDYVVSVCGHANETCPMWLSEEEALGHYRRVRDEIRAFVAQLPEALGNR